MSKIKINYDKVQPLDMVVFSGKGFNPCCCRFSTTGDIFSIFDQSIPCHIGTIIKWEGIHFIAESRSGGVQLNSIENYLDTKNKRYILDIKRDPVFNDQTIQTIVQKQIATDINNMVEFDYKGMFRSLFALFGFKYQHTTGAYYCSEYYYHLTGDYVDYPKYFENNKILPQEIARTASFVSTGAIVV